MAKKIFCGVCAAIALLSCTLFTCIDYSRNLKGPLFYRHYITYNVRTAYRDAQAAEQQRQALRADPTRIEDPSFRREGPGTPGLYPIEWLGIAAAVNVGHTLQITSALLDLNELGIYKLTDVNDLVYQQTPPFAWTEKDEQTDIIDGERFKTGVSALAFSTEDLKTLSETIVHPVTVERLLVNYTYDGKEYTENVPIGKLTLYSADSCLDRLTADTVVSRPPVDGAGLEARGAALSFQVRPGCTVKSVSLPYPKASTDALPLALEQEPDGRITASAAERFEGMGLVYFQLDFIIRGTDADGAEVTAVSDYQNYSFFTMTGGPIHVLAELKNRGERER